MPVRVTLAILVILAMALPLQAQEAKSETFHYLVLVEVTADSVTILNAWKKPGPAEASSKGMIRRVYRLSVRDKSGGEFHTLELSDPFVIHVPPGVNPEVKNEAPKRRESATVLMELPASAVGQTLIFQKRKTGVESGQKAGFEDLATTTLVPEVFEQEAGN